MADEMVTCIVCENKYKTNFPACPRCGSKNAHFKKRTSGGKIVYVAILVVGFSVALAYLAFIGPSLKFSSPQPAALVPDHVSNLTAVGRSGDQNYIISFHIVDRYGQDVPADGTARLLITDEQNTALYDKTFPVSQADFVQHASGFGVGVIWNVPTSSVKAGSGVGTADVEFTTSSGTRLSSQSTDIAVPQITVPSASPTPSGP